MKRPRAWLPFSQRQGVVPPTLVTRPRVPAARCFTLVLYLAACAMLAQAPRDLVLRKRAEDQTAKPVHVPRGFALVIGISRYQNLKGNDLQFAESDADAIYRVLISKEAGAFAAEDVHRLTGSSATFANISRELEEWLPSVAQPEDRVVVYFAGHGFVEKGKGYLAPWDIELDRLDTTGYPMQTLGNVLANRVKARWKVLFTDACHSGKINAETTNEEVSSLLDSAVTTTQFLSLTATMGREKSYEDPDLSTGFGLFSYFLVQGLRGDADNDPCDGWVSAGELVEYVRTQVRQYAKTRGESQTPHEGSDYDPAMVLAKSRGCGTSESAPSMTGTAVIEVNLDDVDVWLDEQYVGKASPGKPLLVPGLASGPHMVRGQMEGYEPDIRRILIAPGQELGVILRIRYRRTVNPAALELLRRGDNLLYTRRSTLNPVNIVPISRSQSEADLKEARSLFTRALQEDPNYSQAAYNLGITKQLLSDEAGSMTAFQRAIEIDPAFVAARLQYAGVVIENGDADEGIRQLTEALRFDLVNDEVHALLARAYFDKGVWDRCVQSADRALDINANSPMAHLWRADCLRQIAVTDKSKEQFVLAGESYRRFLSLTNFSTPVHQWFAYHFIGFHLGGRSHADRGASYDSLRKSGYLGLCICERNTGNPLRAREYCQRAVRYDAQDPIAHFVLGLAHLGAFDKTHACEDLAAARKSFVRMLGLNSKLTESKHAKDYIEQIDTMMPSLRRKGC